MKVKEDTCTNENKKWLQTEKVYMFLIKSSKTKQSE